MTEANRAIIQRNSSAENMKARACAKLAREPDIKASSDRAGYIVQPEALGDGRRRIRQPIEIIGDREMFRDVALPRRYDVATGLQPSIVILPLSSGRSRSA
jgi:hypothetical protein